MMSSSCSKSFRLAAVFVAAWICVLAAPASAQDTFSDSLHTSLDATPLIREKYRPLAQLNALRPCQLPTAGNQVAIFRSGSDLLPLITGDILSARSYVRCGFYKFSDGEVPQQLRRALLSRSLFGVEVSFIEESRTVKGVPRTYYELMPRYGVDHKLFAPLRRPSVLMRHFLRRNHQKMLVVDGRVAYTGGMNIAQTYFNAWEDTQVRIEGPAALSMETLFVGTWKDCGGTLRRPEEEYLRPVSPGGTPSAGTIVQLVSNSPSVRDNRLFAETYVWVAEHAESYLYIQTPYFGPDRKVLDALCSAAARGVDVRLMVPVKSDVPFAGSLSRSYFGKLTREGVRVYQKTGRFIHSKTFVSDDYLLAIGSVNLDSFSLHLNYEDNAYFYDEELARQYREEFLRDQEGSDEVTGETMAGWSVWERVMQVLTRLFRWTL